MKSFLVVVGGGCWWRLVEVVGGGCWWRLLVEVVEDITPMSRQKDFRCGC